MIFVSFAENGKQRGTMPYIDQKSRDYLHKQTLDELINKSYRLTPGEITYIFCSILWKRFQTNPSYFNINEIMGVLACAQHEFYQTQAVPHEVIKKDRNGDL